MSELLAAIQGILRGEDGQITIRHLFYRLVGQRLIEKIEKAYKSLCAHLSRWRRLEEIAWSAFADNTRWHIRQPTFEGVEDALKNTVENYRRNLWATQPFYIEVWVEKDAIAGIVAGTANSWGVRRGQHVQSGKRSRQDWHHLPSWRFRPVRRRGG
ncbi:MAG: hypothetical protein DME23_13185 [Verrucomicrobia bacterium]|nr:MAG: hypothetical protein DME23_13185 [Verrucomicrobiota bacterium]